jgi:archaemetzincin
MAVSDIVSVRFGMPCRFDSDILDPSLFYDPERDQYHSTRILKTISDQTPDDYVKVLGLTEIDLFIPILTFVFGEAILGGRSAIVSTHRLYQEFYGLPGDEDLLIRRTEKEVIHELGHTFGLIHCRDCQCVMHASRDVEEVDVKSSAFCERCVSTFLSESPSS